MKKSTAWQKFNKIYQHQTLISSNCLGTSFLLLWGHPLVHFGLQNTWILEVKAVRLGFCPVQFRKHTHWVIYEKSAVQVENKFQDVQGNLMI